MIYRIDMQHYLSHAIDYFTAEELTHFQYAVISAAIKNGGKAANISKISELYPFPEIVLEYSEYRNKEVMEKMYMELLNPKSENEGIGINAIANIFYRTFVNPLLQHCDIVIICDREENDYIDVLCKVLKKKYMIDVIDLNKLFSEGQIGPIYIDRDEIWDKAVDIRRITAKDNIKALESTSGGRQHLLKMMSKKDKIEKIKELGINLTSHNNKELDAILLDAWVNDDEDD